MSVGAFGRSFCHRAAAFAAALFLCVIMFFATDITAFSAEGSWQQDTKGWWYLLDDGGYSAAGWEYIDGDMYYFDREGYLVTNCLVADSGYIYIVDSDGRMLKDTSLHMNGTEYVIDSQGHAVTAAIYYASVGIGANSGETAPTGTGHTLGAAQQTQGGSTASGWRSDDTGSWFVKADGSYPVDAWENIGGTWYHFDSLGYMEKDRLVSFPDGTYRYLGNDGAPVKDTELSLDGVDYTVDSEGVAVPKAPPKTENELAAEAYAANIVSQITNASMTKQQKAAAIYNWLRSNIRYTSSGPQSDEAYSALYGFRRRSGCCYEYYAMAHFMLEAAGMPNIPVIRASDRGHYWNLVDIDGTWYHFDATPRRLGGNWCLVTTDYLRRNSWSSHNFDVSAYPATP